MQIKAFCQDVWIWQRRQRKAVIICILIFISSVIQRFLGCPWFNSLHYVVGQKNKHYLESNYPFRPRATGLLRLMDITDHIKPRCKREGKKQTGETVAVYYCLLLAKAALTENHKAHIEGVKISLNYFKLCTVWLHSYLWPLWSADGRKDPGLYSCYKLCPNIYWNVFFSQF